MVAGSLDDAILFEDTEVITAGAGSTPRLMLKTKDGASYVAAVETLVEIIDMELTPPRVL